MRSPENAARQPAPRVAEDGDGIDEISDRLTSLAHRIEEYNTTRKSSRLTGSPVDDFLPAFLNPLSASRDNDDGDDILPASLRPGAEVNLGLPPKQPYDIDSHGRMWPALPVAKPPAAAAIPSALDFLKEKVEALETKTRAQADELFDCHNQIAELAEIRQTQATTLQAAAEQIDRLGKGLSSLRQMAADRESEVSEATRKLFESETEKVALQGQLAAERKQVNQLSLRLLNVEGILNDKSVDGASYRETIECLTAELDSVKLAADRRQAEALRQSGAEYEDRIAAIKNQKQAAERRHAETLQQLGAEFEVRIADFHARIDGRDAIIEQHARANRELSACCNDLSVKISALESLQRHCGDTIEAQVGYIEFMEAVLKVERENAQATIRALVDEFQRERAEIESGEPDCAEPSNNRNIVQLLPTPTERQDALAQETQTAADADLARTGIDFSRVA